MSKSVFAKAVSIFITITIFVIILTPQVFASELKGLSFSFNQITGAVTVSSVHSAGSGQLITLYIYKNDTPDDCYNQQEIITGSNGSFDITVNMDTETDESGYYTAIIGGNNINAIKKQYVFVSNTDATKIIQKINVSKSPDDILNILVESDYLIDVDLSEESDYGSLENTKIICEALIGKGFSNLPDVSKVFNQAVCLQRLNEGLISTAIQIIRDNSTILGIDTGDNSYFKCIRYDVNKSTIYSSIIGKDFTVKNIDIFISTFNAMSALACINDIDTTNRDKFSYVIERMMNEGIMIKNNDYLSLSNNDKTEVNILTLTKQPFSTILELQRSLESSIDILDDSKSSKVGRSTGGGRSSDSFVALTTDIPAQSNTVNNFSFKDIDSVEWAKESIAYLTASGVLSKSEDGNFEPDRLITREEFVKMLVIAFDCVDSTATASFSDVNNEDWFYLYISSAKKHGIVTGISESKFGVGMVINRQEMALMIYRILGNKNMEYIRDESKFSDNSEIAEYAQTAVNSLYRMGIINGMSEGSFKPNDGCSRAMAAKVIYNSMINKGVIN